ncbi:MAG: ABC transporter permease, partial [Dehalococcoidales bacterium]|nr:ABC transporter permease [Dehalococcoidales bacterium]
MKTFKDIWYIALKDLKIFASDRMSVFFFVVFPLMFIVLFNFLMSGVGSGDERLVLHMTTQEEAGGLSHQILGAMETPDEALLNPGEPQIVWERDYAAARQAVDDGDLPGFVSFPADFTAALNTGEATDLEVYASADSINTRAALNGLAGAISSQIGAHRVVIEASLSLLLESGAVSPQNIEQVVLQMMDELFASGSAGAESLYVTFRTEKIG